MEFDRDNAAEILKEHGLRPRNSGALRNATHRASGRNPSCGDSVHVTLHVEGTIDDVRVTCEGCALCTASASIMSRAVHGKQPEEAIKAVQALADAIVQPIGADVSEDVGDAWPLVAVREWPLRAKCAMLPWRALEAALTRAKDVTTE